MLWKWPATGQLHTCKRYTHAATHKNIMAVPQRSSIGYAHTLAVISAVTWALNRRAARSATGKLDVLPISEQLFRGAPFGTPEKDSKATLFATLWKYFLSYRPGSKTMTFENARQLSFTTTNKKQKPFVT